MLCSFLPVHTKEKKVDIHSLAFHIKFLKDFFLIGPCESPVKLDASGTSAINYLTNLFWIVQVEITPCFSTCYPHFIVLFPYL